MQGSSFDQLARIMINISDSQSNPDIITKLDNEIPVAAEYVRVKADEVATCIKQFSLMYQTYI